MKSALLSTTFLLSIASLASSAPIEPRQGGLWKLIGTIGNVVSTGSTVYGLLGGGNSNNNPPTGGYPYPTYAPYSSYYPYYGYAGASYLPRPDQYTGATSASTFVTNGGGWTNSTTNLPGTISIDNPPYSNNCYGLTPTSVVSWLTEFQTTYRQLTTRYPTIRTSPQFWANCTGNNPSFGNISALWVVQPTFPTSVPTGWSNWTFWDDGVSGLSTSNVATVYNGGLSSLESLIIDVITALFG